MASSGSGNLGLGGVDDHLVGGRIEQGRQVIGRVRFILNNQAA
jgi:hypothetical protein